MMLFEIMKAVVGVGLLAACETIGAPSVSAAETHIFSRQQSFVDRGTIDLDDASCVRQQCFSSTLPSNWNPVHSDESHLYATTDVADRIGTSSNAATLVQTQAGHILRSARGDGAMLSTRQIGEGNRIVSVQDPSAMAVNAILTQAGQDNHIVGFQQGSYNVALVAQNGVQNVSSFSQAGSGNTLIVRQH